MSEKSKVAPLQVFHGQSQAATYRRQLVRSYEGNPLIEGLPDILSVPHAMKLLAYHPIFDPKDRNLPPEIRIHQIQGAMRFFEPLPIHIDIEQRFSRMIRDGYVGRNPVAKGHWQELDKRVDIIAKSGGIPLQSSAANGFLIVGLPGMGKTFTVERLLQLYPQILNHTEYQGKPFSRIQITWLKLTCPHDGSIKGLALSFFQAIDDLLGTDYYKLCTGNGKRTVDELIPAMARVAWAHCLGLLVVDEVQHLNNSKSGGADRMLGFFLQLMNTLGLPVLLIGTYAALSILNRELRQIRRSSGLGDVVWERMPNDDVWKLFVEGLWRYQYVRNPVPLDKELSDTLYDECQGITDFAVKLFILAQIRAIVSGYEKITATIIRSVAHDSLRLAKPVIQALRTGKTEELAAMSDIHPIEIPSAIRDIQRKQLLGKLSENSQSTNGGDVRPAVPDSLESTQVMSADHRESFQNGTPKKVRRPKKSEIASQCPLVQTANEGAKNGISAHDALVASGAIKPLFNLKNRAI
jgi:hypothetical protein